MARAAGEARGAPRRHQAPRSRSAPFQRLLSLPPCLFPSRLGTASGVDALRAARVVASDVRAIDVNMGCPVKFSTAGGMGSALLTQPEKARPQHSDESAESAREGNR